MRQFWLEVTQFGHKVFDVVAARVKLFTLSHRVKDPKVRCGIHATTRRPLPAAVIAGKITVNQ